MSRKNIGAGSPHVEPGHVVRLNASGAPEIVKLPWGLRPREPGGHAYKAVRSEGKDFPSHRCLIPASEFFKEIDGRQFKITLRSGDHFYLAGIWRPAREDWPECYTILTTGSNPDLMSYQERQMAVLTRGEHLPWLTMTKPVEEVLRPQPAGTFEITEVHGRERELAQRSLFA